MTSVQRPKAAPQFHCYINLLIDQPQLHLSLETLWSVDDSLKSTKEFMDAFVGRWKTSPPTMSHYLIDFGILHAIYTNFTAPFAPSSIRAEPTCGNVDLPVRS